MPNTNNTVGVHETRDNGGTPFIVKILDENNVQIYEEDNLVYSHRVEKVFIGKSPRCSMTERSGCHGPEFDGNTVLLHEKDYTYVFVGSVIQKFESKSTIVKYVSLVGNSNVAYPYAVDDQGRHYLLIEDVLVSKIPEDHGLDVYTWYHEACQLTPMRRGNPNVEYPYEDYRASSYKDPVKSWMWSYNPYPDPLRWTQRAVKKNGVWSNITEQDENDIQNTFASEKGFQTLEMTDY